ncbi:MAG: hypothetical protein PHH11_03835 [Methylomonas sp.]|nr:hypothetical protein [Methylomonas sp.]
MRPVIIFARYSVIFMALLYTAICSVSFLKCSIFERAMAGYRAATPSTPWIGGLLACLLSMTTPAMAGENLPQSEAQGYVDSLLIESNRLIAEGWASSSIPNNHVVSISIWLGEQLIYQGRYEKFERPDVVAATGRSDWLLSGWRINAPLPDNSNMDKALVRVRAIMDNGSQVELHSSDRISPLSVVSPPFFDRALKYKVILVLLLALPGTAYFRGVSLGNWLSRKLDKSIEPCVIFGFALFLSFCILIGLGITGSSFGIGVEQTPFVRTDASKIWLKDQPIRSDEWLVFTPLAVAQYNHQPKFPIINENLGEDGQNMLSIGMSGVPVAHLSAIAKPATWGFFLFDLKRALSWYWLFPIFACLFAVWGVVNVLLQGQWRASFLIALCFSLSPYVAAWSNWPAYTVFFPSLALLSALAILRADGKYALLFSSGILGLSLAGFVLVLYPPWQVSVGYVFLALFGAVVVRDKLHRNINSVRLVSYGFSIILACLILWKWWTDAHPAIQAMLDTVYPGQRTSVTGGNVSMPELLRGFTNLVTLYKLDSVYANPSEISSFCYMFLPLAFLFLFRWHQRAIGAVDIALAASIGVILYFMLVGIPVELARLSLWGRVPPHRADLALGLSSILLSGSLLSADIKTGGYEMPRRSWALAIALVWAAIAFNSISDLQEGILSGFTPSILIGLFFVTFAMGYWLALGKFKNFIYSTLALYSATILPFNPVNIAPHHFTASSFINEFHNKQSDAAISQRILVLDTHVPAMYLLASGFPVANGIFYYPQKSLWERLDKDHTGTNIYNRYQHLLFSGGVVDNYRIESPQDDIVRVVIDPENFDFRKTGAGFITAPQHEEILLKKNATLTFIQNNMAWSWFKVQGSH